MSCFFTSDFHLGHKVIAPKYRTAFSSAEEHDAKLFALMSALTKRDVLYILGDFIFDCPQYDWYLEQIAKFPFRIKLVMGNHDSVRMYELSRPANIELQKPFFTYKHFWVSHCPIHPMEIHGRRGVIHGHLHNAVVPDPRYFNVCLDQHYSSFVPFETIKEYYDRLESNTETLGPGTTRST